MREQHVRFHKKNADGSAGGNEEAGHGETYDVGQEGFDRVALAMGGQQVLSPLPASHAALT